MENSKSNPIAITGLGVVGPFGTTLDQLWEAQQEADAEFMPCSRYDNGLPAAEAEKVNLRQMLKTGQLSRVPLVSQYAVAATHLALEQSGLNVDRKTKSADIGIVFGTSNGPGAATQQIYDDLIDVGATGVKPRVFQESVFNAPASLTSIYFGLSGPIQVVPGAGCSGTAVLYQAQMMLAQPGIQAVIALCSEELCSAIQLGLHDLKWHASFDKEGGVGAGAIMGEGAVALVLENAETAKDRGAGILAELAGVGYCNDAAALGRPDPNGQGLVAAIETCLEDASAIPRDIDMVLTGSVGTWIDDTLEGAAMRTVFANDPPPQGSSKRSIGFAMGTAALFEVALAIASVLRKTTPGCVPTKDDRVSTVLCNSIGLNGLFGATLVRSAT